MAMLTAEAAKRRPSRTCTSPWEGLPMGDQRDRMRTACMASVVGMGLNIWRRMTSSVNFWSLGTTADRVVGSRCRLATKHRAKIRTGLLPPW